MASSEIFIILMASELNLMNMDDKNSNQYKYVFDENGCMKCRHPNWRQKQLSVVTRRLDK